MNIEREGVCLFMSRLAAGQRVTVVFDGRPPRLGLNISECPVDVIFSQRRTADDVIIELIAADTAPRRLTVISTDHEIRRAARRRRCRTVTSEQFVSAGKKSLARPRSTGPAEPPEKRAGLTPEQTKKWLKELNIPEEDEDEYHIR